MAITTFKLSPKGPFSLAVSANVLKAFPPLTHQPKAITIADETVVRLGFILDGDHRSVAVSLREDDAGQIHGTVVGTKRVDAVAAQVARIFGLDHDATAYADIKKRDPKIAPLMNAFAGLRHVSFTSPYECACWAVISQRIQKTQAARIVAELVRAHGEKLRLPISKNEIQEIGVFPSPDRLLDVRSVPSLQAVKVERLHAIAKATIDGELDAKTILAKGDIEGPKSLLALPGIGPFWASGIYLRACGVVDAFPEEPLSIAALGHLHGLGDHPSPAAITKLTDRYKPFRMWICFLLRVAAGRGMLGEMPAIPRKSASPRLGLHAASPKSRAHRGAGIRA
jgi:DNA-3-methyladenine glycosylase II